MCVCAFLLTCFPIAASRCRTRGFPKNFLAERILLPTLFRRPRQGGLAAPSPLFDCCFQEEEVPENRLQELKETSVRRTDHSKFSRSKRQGMKGKPKICHDEAVETKETEAMFLFSRSTENNSRFVVIKICSSCGSRSHDSTLRKRGEEGERAAWLERV